MWHNIAMEREFKLYTNGEKSYVLNPFLQFAASAEELNLAAPYFCRNTEIFKAIEVGKKVNLLIELNPITDPVALRQIMGKPGINIRYFTARFHAKIYLFGEHALVGSANLTDAGLMQNREASIVINSGDDPDLMDELRIFFSELWDAAAVLTPQILEAFSTSRSRAAALARELKEEVLKGVPASEPRSIRVESRTDTTEKLFLQELRRTVYEQYQPAFEEVGKLLLENKLQRSEFGPYRTQTEVNRFLNWVRLQHGGGNAWETIGRLTANERQRRVIGYGQEWRSTEDPRLDPYFFEWHEAVQRTFGTRDSISAADKDELMEGLRSLHAFSEQFRFTAGGADQLGPAFWQMNSDDVDKVRRTLIHLLYGPEEFIQRLHDVLYDQSFKIKKFGKFTALELFGTLNPEQCPPMNGRMAKALTFLGYDVGG